MMKRKKIKDARIGKLAVKGFFHIKVVDVDIDQNHESYYNSIVTFRIEDHRYGFYYTDLLFLVDHCYIIEGTPLKYELVTTDFADNPKIIKILGISPSSA